MRTTEAHDVSAGLPQAFTPPRVVSLTASARRKVAELIAAHGDPELVLRLAVRPGGCSGLGYEIYIDRELFDDVTVSCGSGRLVIDPISAKLLSGSRLDYREDGEWGAFGIDNPTAVGTCGCGDGLR